jgi:hypothetical protein
MIMIIVILRQVLSAGLSNGCAADYFQHHNDASIVSIYVDVWCSSGSSLRRLFVS